MNEYLVQINWELITQDEANNGIYDDIFFTILDLENKEFCPINDVIKPVLIMFNGIGTYMGEYTIETGENWFWGDEKNSYIFRNSIIDYINKSLNPVDFNGRNFSDILKFKKPTSGEFFLVFKIDFFDSSHSLDPTEYDTSETFLGILGHDVKLTY